MQALNKVSEALSRMGGNQVTYRISAVRTRAAGRPKTGVVGGQGVCRIPWSTNGRALGAWCLGAHAGGTSIGFNLALSPWQPQDLAQPHPSGADSAVAPIGFHGIQNRMVVKRM